MVIALVGIMVGTFIVNKLKEDKIEIDEQPLTQEVDLKNNDWKGQKAPDFTLQTLDGESVKLSDLQGKKVILNFWATWCPPCKSEMPHFQDYYEEYAKEDNVEILAVNLTIQDKVKDVDSFVENYGLTFPVLLLDKPGLNNTYKVISIPTTYMIDTNGVIQEQILGPLNTDELRDYVSQLD